MSVRWLDQVRAGEVVRMVGFARCRNRSLQLAEMGLTPGTRIEVLQAARGQPMLLRVRGSQLAVGRETARTIEVAALEVVPGGEAEHRKGLLVSGVRRGFRERSRRHTRHAKHVRVNKPQEREA